MPNCAVVGCLNRHDKRSGSVTFHRFPTDEEAQIDWLKCCGRCLNMNSSKLRICSSHFAAEDFERDLQGELMGLPLKRRLKKGVTPHLNLIQIKEEPIDYEDWDGPIAAPDVGFYVAAAPSDKEVCELHFTVADIETTTSAYDEKKKKLITVPLSLSRIRKGAVPSIFPVRPSYSFTRNYSQSRRWPWPSIKRIRLENEQLEEAIQKRVKLENEDDTCAYLHMLQSTELDDTLYNEKQDKTEKCTSVTESTSVEQLQVFETTMEASQIPTHSANTRVPSSLPARQNWPGQYGFTVSFGPQEKNTKGVSWTYSKMKDKLYVGKDASCPINFSTNNVLPNDVTIRAMALYSSPEQISNVVHRCVNHSMEELRKGIFEAEHLVRCESSVASYQVDPATKRHSVVVPFENPPAGQQFSTYIYKFSCFGSCAGGPNRRPLMIVFTLEKDNQEIGRRKLDVKICACPGRDRKSEETQLAVKEGPVSIKRKEPAEFVQLSDTLEFTRSVGYPPAKKAKVVPNRDGKFTMMVDNLECYEFLKQMKKFYEICKVMKNLPPDVKRTLIHFQRKKEEEESG